MHEAVSRLENKNKIKNLLKKLHEKPDSNEVKQELKRIVCDLQPPEIAAIEEELVKEGMSKEELQKFCDIHLEVFKEALEKEQPIAPEGHPVRILMEEHKIMLQFTEKLRKIIEKSLNSQINKNQALNEIEHVIKHFKESEKHYQREENVLFPYLEKKGITQPPAIMWMEHDKIRTIKKSIYQVFEEQSSGDFEKFLNKLTEANIMLNDMLLSHFTKENKILFPTALNVIDETEWSEITEQFEEIGYCCFTPQPERRTGLQISKSAPQVTGASLNFETGTLTLEEISSILNTLPVDITFVDKDDKVKYYSNNENRIFIRTKAVIGRKVQQCHPQKSIHIVERILEEFKKGERKVAEFWINLNERLIHIRYFPVYSRENQYLGCIEVTQDVTDIQKLKGEKRLLD